ncbi:MAG: ribokinase [Chloroflexi bacterium]|nr:ribokinase [Chloroflexota bacterium]
MPHPIVVVGSINMDVVARTQNHPRPGETVFGEDLQFIPGGKGSNQAVAASRLGGNVTLIGKLGSDAFGDTMAAFLKEENLDLAYVRRAEMLPTGTALIVVNAASENTIVVVPGSNSALLPTDTDLLPIHRQMVALAQFEVPQETTYRLFERVHATEGITILNPAPAGEVMPGLMELVDYLVVNETELAFFSGSDHIPDNTAQIASQAKKLRSHTSQTIVVTCGPKGVVCIKRDEILTVDGRAVDAVDTTGAGDCFVGAFAVALAEGRGISEALHFANQAAALSVQKLGASTSMPYRHEVI